MSRTGGSVFVMRRKPPSISVSLHSLTRHILTVIKQCCDTVKVGHDLADTSNARLTSAGDVHYSARSGVRESVTHAIVAGRHERRSQIDGSPLHSSR